MTKQEIRDVLSRQMQRLETTARTHDHPRVITAVTREMVSLSRELREMEVEEHVGETD